MARLGRGIPLQALVLRTHAIGAIIGLAASFSCSSSLSASLTTGIPLQASLGSQAIVAASLTAPSSITHAKVLTYAVQRRRLPPPILLQGSAASGTPALQAALTAQSTLTADLTSPGRRSGTVLVFNPAHQAVAYRRAVNLETGMGLVPGAYQSTSAALQAGPAAQATLTANLTTGIRLVAVPMQAVSTFTADLTTGIALQAALAAQATLVAQLAGGAQFQAVLIAQPQLLAPLSTGIPLQLVVAARSTVAAALSTGIPLQSSLAGVAVLVAAMDLGPGAEQVVELEDVGLPVIVLVDLGLPEITLSDRGTP
ncbi:MAG TPA: hypothetical protein VJN95_08790 [Gemmatimonadales bacterium]|nr:hypothetical protein [Gemmatimonadales bacterium]